ncbi:MAG: polysaccharide biosynthesis C-terminal domain-containing protein, partial [Clostridiales bacterium]|nr:polysaccharide biosynthesis C-terminal domain-containing protein [Clostridiales bacterium]
IMALGQLAGEAASAIFCAGCMYYLNRQTTSQKSLPHIQIRFLRQTLSVSLPLALNRMLMCILQAVEASLLPQMLQRSGYTSREALSIYGTFTGMALPLIFFPTAITSSLGMLLLPTVSEAHALRHQDRISYTTNATFLGSFLLGSFFLGMFLLFGEQSGNLIFHSNLAGIYIRQLALICPLIYINTSMINILHGLDRSASILLWNMAGFALRLSGILMLVPEYGMTGYLSGLMADQLLLSICILFSLRRLKLFTVSIPDTLTQMLLPALSGGAIVFASSAIFPSKIPALVHLLLGGVIYSILFLLTALFFSVPKKQRARLFQSLHSALRQN